MNGHDWHLPQRVRALTRRRRRFLLGAAGCFGLVFAATLCVGLEDSGHLIWMANGILLAYLLLVPRWTWPRYFSAAFVAEFAAGVAVNPDRWAAYLALTALNLVESGIAAFLLRPRSAVLPRFTDRRYLTRFLWSAAAVAPFVAGSIFAVVYAVGFKAEGLVALRAWMVTDGLGNAIAAPACVVLLRTGLREHVAWRSHWLFAVALVALTVASFCQAIIPLVFLIYPLMTLILVCFGLGWSALATVFITVVSGWCTLHGLGPFARVHWFRPAGPMVLLQLYIACGVFMLFVVATVLDDLRNTQRKLASTVALHQLVVENSRDVIILADFDGHRNFVSTAAWTMGGWRPSDVVRYQSLALVHPDDQARVTVLVGELRSGKTTSALIECRVRKSDGQYVWVESSLRVVTDAVTQKPVGILNMVRDIARRKAADEALHKAYHALETLAATDPLTRLANRRRLDQYLGSEWHRARRDRKPLSFLLLDVDFFKSYNDLYGHLPGDHCLKRLAEIISGSATRPGDLVARFGGEEFALVLPNTPQEGALEVARQLCERIRSCRIPHTGNALGFLTVSIGCATTVPAEGQYPRNLIQQADDALYAAKRNGRDQAGCAPAGQPANAAAG